jgi:ATPase subunit of ABC transporter with duplicated ATPase domains
MDRYVLTGAPGAGKTSVLRVLHEQGFAVVEETATDVISREQRSGVARLWQHADLSTRSPSFRGNGFGNRWAMSGCRCMTGRRCAP